MVLKEDIPILDLFRKSVDAGREALTKVEVREELTYHYAIVRVYSKMLVSSCAIYTLLINGYPDDAMALCRQLYNEVPTHCLFVQNCIGLDEGATHYWGPFPGKQQYLLD